MLGRAGTHVFDEAGEPAASLPAVRRTAQPQLLVVEDAFEGGCLPGVLGPEASEVAGGGANRVPFVGKVDDFANLIATT